KQNLSGRFEGRVSLVEIADTPSSQQSVFLRGMGGSVLPVAVAHGEGRATYIAPASEAEGRDAVVVRYVDPTGQPTSRYPYCPNGSAEGTTGVQALDGRVLALMPHPERTTMASSMSWSPRGSAEEWKNRGPWMRLFENARVWVG
ncbi:hypothetical protein JCM1840_005607, partial [Sporobolomyces johnsonii]